MKKCKYRALLLLLLFMAHQAPCYANDSTPKKKSLDSTAVKTSPVHRGAESIKGFFNSVGGFLNDAVITPTAHTLGFNDKAYTKAPSEPSPDSAMADNDMSAAIILLCVVIPIALCIYFFPAIIASNRRKMNAGIIFWLNLFLGGTGIGWLILLIWACMDEERWK